MCVSRVLRFRVPGHLASVAALNICLLCWSALADQQSASVVEIESGRVRGSGTTVRLYRGLPFAAPPIGELRWRPPQPPARWKGVRDATQFGPDCVQRARWAAPRAAGMSEDCLYLNIWTPASKNTEKLPVMIWLYGGNFMFGSGAHELYDGEQLARQGVVVVSFNYRVGVFGFLAHRQLTEESRRRSSGNYGLLDQIAALQWVRRNISAFGGDPDNVTAFGSSAGGTSLSLLLVSPLAKGLFHRAILQSPGAVRPMSSLADAERVGVAVGSDLAALRRVSAGGLEEKYRRLQPRIRQVTAARTVGPIIDGWVVPRSERSAYELKLVHSVPLLIGSNTDEGALFVPDSPFKTVAEFRQYANENFGSLANELFTRYSVASEADLGRAVKEIFADTQFNYGVRWTARAMSRLQRKTFRYYFTQRRGGTDAHPTHADEIAYVFGTFDAPMTGRNSAPTHSDRLISKLMMGSWVRFARTGDPNGGGLPSWPPCDDSTDPFMEFGGSVKPGRGMRNEYLDFVERFFGSNHPLNR